MNLSGGESAFHSPEKLDLLARIISAEAKGESYNTQVAVGAVILNRVKSSNFPNSIPEVINQKSSGVYQFSPVANGAINNPATESAKKAALDAVNGADPSNGALFFFESNTTNKWLLSKPVTAKLVLHKKCVPRKDWGTHFKFVVLLG